MLATTNASTYSDSAARPGLTSLIHTGRGIMTVQTEVIGEPAQLVTIVDFRGRVLKTWRSSFLVSAADVDSARRWHQQIEVEVRGTLSRAARKLPEQRDNNVAACLFVEAMRAYGVRDFERAQTLLDACDRLVPGDVRIGSARERVRARVAM